MKNSMSKPKYDFNFLGFRNVAFIVSAAILLLTLALYVFKGFNFGIDFTGGIVVEARFLDKEKKAAENEIRELRYAVTDAGYDLPTVQSMGENSFMVRVQGRAEEQKEDVANLKKAILNYEKNLEFLRIDFVGPKVSENLFMDGMIALILSMLAIMAYIGLRFNWQFSIAAVAAIVHDIVVIIGFYLITGFEFDLTAVAAILTVIGYSINDTVVIFDRIRENLRKHSKMDLSRLINLSINETLSRTMLTSLTTLMACFALILLGGQVLIAFSLAVSLGIIFGTYSSMYVATPIFLHVCCQFSDKSTGGQQQAQA
jgi:preprotein translocase subunit SecF